MKKTKQWLSILLGAVLLGCASQPVSEQPSAAETTPPKPEKDPYVLRAEGIAEDMSLKEKIEQLMIISVQTYGGSPFTELNDDIAGMVKEHSYGGLILFSGNCVNPAQTAGLTYDLQHAAAEDNGIPLLLCIDQEGGNMVRVSGSTGTPGNMALGASGQSRLAASAASIIGGELSALGFNTDFAPCADVNNEPANPVIGLRSFSENPLLAAECAEAYAAALQEEGIISCAKHFPGHGNTTVDSHTGLPVSSAGMEDLKQTELVPFHALCPDDTDMIMTAHICFPSVEPDQYQSVYDGSEITLPATLSDDMVQGVLRNELGYEGVVCTDSMLMEAIHTHFDPIDAAVLAWNAGVDILLMPKNVDSRAAMEELDEYVDALVSLVNERIDEARINESVIRVLAMKARRGILDFDQTKERDAAVETAVQTVGSAENHESERAIADQCVTVVKNENVLPLQDGNVLFAGVQESQRASLQFGMDRLMKQINLVNTPAYINISYGKALPDAASLGQYDAVVVTSWLDNMSQLDPSESVMIPGIQHLIRSCREAGVPIIVISTGLPYDLSCYTEADALLAVYNPTGISYAENGELSGAIGPNIPAAIDILYGYAHPSGQLPVNIPAVEGKGFGDTIVYPIKTGLTW